MSDNVCEYCEREFDSSKGLSVHIGWEHEDKSKNEFTCENCGDTVYKYESRMNHREQKNIFCSKECKDSYEREGKYFNCSYCDDKLYKSPSKIDEMGKYDIENHFCNKECEKNWKRNNWVGKEHPSWEGGEIEYGDNWSRRRRMTLERDNHTCQNCGITQEEYSEIYDRQLDVHHIVPIRELDDKEKANSLQNLVTLCISCHRKLEKHNPITQEKILI
jgi:5-methylcytosine-specific restriction endonuclease McrA